MKECSHNHRDLKKENKTFMGLIILFIGFVLLGRNLDFIPFSFTHVFFSWPMFLIGLGLLMIAGKGKSLGGLFLIGTGGLFLWDRLSPFTSFQWKIAWPMLFIFVGAMLVISYLTKSFKELSKPEQKKPAAKHKKTDYRNVEFDIDKIEPIE